jgi:predicted methyltransferase
VNRSAAIGWMIAAVGLGGCSFGTSADPAESSGAARGAQATLAAVIAGPWRSSAERAEDPFRRPEETLRYLGLGSGQAIVEVWPGAGWCSQILAPYAARTGGRYFAAHPSPGMTGSQGDALVARFRAQVSAHPDLYGEVQEAAFSSRVDRLGLTTEAADLVLFPERLHYWMAAGLAEAAFGQAYAALKPGGLLGVIQARAPAGGPQDPIARNGAVQQAFVIALAHEAGFVLDAEPLRYQSVGKAGPHRTVYRFRKPSQPATVSTTQAPSPAPGPRA